MKSNFEQYKSKIKDSVISKVDYSKDISDEEMYELIDDCLSENLRSLAVSVEDRKRLRQQVFHSIRKLDVLQQLVDDPSVTDV